MGATFTADASPPELRHFKCYTCERYGADQRCEECRGLGVITFTGQAQEVHVGYGRIARFLERYDLEAGEDAICGRLSHAVCLTLVHHPLFGHRGRAEELDERLDDIVRWAATHRSTVTWG